MSLRLLHEGFERRYRSIVEHSKRFHVPPPDKAKLWRKVLEVYRNGFKCEYCGRKMKLKANNKFDGDVWSIDHKISLYMGGDNSIENLAIVCHRCNIVKGTMTEKTFMKLLHLIKTHDPPLLDQLYKEIIAGRLANKIEREKWLKTL